MTTTTDVFQVEIPGEPMAQPRAGRHLRTNAAGVPYVQSFTPPKVGHWRARAAMAMQAALRLRNLPEPFVPSGPIWLSLLLIHSCPKGRRRKRSVAPREWRDRKPDLDNCEKAIKDAARGILWMDDNQVAFVQKAQIDGEQDEAPRVIVAVSSLEDVPVGPVLGAILQWPSSPSRAPDLRQQRLLDVASP